MLNFLLIKVKNQPFNLLFYSTPLVVSVAALLAFGVFGLGRAGTGLSDFNWFYTAGRMFLNGQNPYNPEIFASLFQEFTGKTADLPLAYPPQFAPWCILFALFDYSSARMVIILLNLLAVSLLAFFTMRLVIEADIPRPASFMPATRWLIPALIVGNPFTTHLVWLGQVTLVAAALMVGAWYFARQNKPLLAGLLLGLSTFKPQFVILPALWLLLDRQWRILAVTAITSLTLASYALLTLGPISAIREWLHALSQYQSAPPNTLGSQEVTGLPSALAAVGLDMPDAFVLIIGGAALTFLFWLGKSQLCSDDILGILVSIQIALVYAHNGEIVLLAPLVSSLWLHLAHRQKLCAVAIVVLPILFFPQRFVRELNIPVLNHWRTLIILFAFFALIFLSWQQKQRVPSKVSFNS